MKKLLTFGQTGAEIAVATGISFPSIQAIKKSIDLVKVRQEVTSRRCVKGDTLTLLR